MAKRLSAFVSLCEKLAAKSPVRCAQHGACVVHQGEVISSAYNKYTRHSQMPRFQSRQEKHRGQEPRSAHETPFKLRGGRDCPPHLSC